MEIRTDHAEQTMWNCKINCEVEMHLNRIPLEIDILNNNLKNMKN